jgi:two-component system sensor histidine kinase SenX3
MSCGLGQVTASGRREQRDLRVIVREAVEEQRLAWPQRPLSLTLPGRPVLLWVDGDRVGQVVMNFLTNALKYSSEKEPVATTVRVQQGLVWVGVSDHGPGIRREEQPRLWDRFHRVAAINGRRTRRQAGLSPSQAPTFRQE